ncbi:MAG: polymerase subunit sigma-24 [Bacteroidetes bacterium]|jgi:RNA polymerase sigma-70 factor (ECF subfamily)|nr:polymerase subunit sigma-24 [Bacteroidota bacterium]
MTVAEFNTCVDQYADNLYRFILKTVRDKDIAKDIVQDTYEKLWLKVSEVESSNAKSYMFTTGYRTMIDFIRREKKKQVWNDGYEDLHSHSKQYNDLKQILNEAVDKLPEDQKAVILLRDYEGYEYKEIGEITGLSESQVKVYIFRARQFLKNYIGKAEVLV